MKNDMTLLKLQEEIKTNEIKRESEERDTLIFSSAVAFIIFLFSISLVNINAFSKNKNITELGEKALVEVNETSRMLNSLGINVNGEQLLNFVSFTAIFTSTCLGFAVSKKQKDIKYLKDDRNLIETTGQKLYGDEYNNLVLKEDKKVKTKKAIK